MKKMSDLCYSVPVVLWGLGAATGSGYALAQDHVLNKVEVTGSALRRVDAETALPVQVLTKEEIARTGVTSTEQLLQTVSALASAGAVSSATGAGTSNYGNSTISLRGLESSRTLVLVNGRRLASFADETKGVNINSIPLAAIDRVEVLKDGASSIYGSDAMAGVVNFILSKSFEGIAFSAGYGSPTSNGGGQNQNISFTLGLGTADTPYKGVVSFSSEQDTALYGRDRSYAASAINLPYYSGTATGQGNIEGAVTPGAYPNDRQPGLFGTSPGTGYGNPMAALGKCGDIKMFYAGLTSKGQPYCQFDSGSYVALVPDRTLSNLTGNFSYAISPSTELFTDLLYSQSKVTVTFQGSPLRRSFSTTNNRLIKEGVDPSLIIYPQNPNYPTAYLTQYAPALLGKPLAVTARVMDFGGRQSTDLATQTRLVAGARGTIAEQDYEIAVSQNSSKLQGQLTGGYFSITDYNKIINDPSSNWNPWSPTGQSSALLAKLKTAQYIGPSLDAESKSQGMDAKLSGDLFKLGAQTAQYALGLQARNESLSRTPAEKPGSGDISGAGGAAFAIDKSRNATGGFAELSLPFTKELEANISARSDKYSDMGNASTYKVSGRWQPSPLFVVRASTNTGFRAPTLPELFQPQILQTSEQFNDNGPGGTGQTDLQVSATVGGNPNLRPETSTASSVGLVISPMKDFSFGLDWFQIKISDIIQTPGVQEVVSGFRKGDAAFAGLVKLAPGSNDIDSVTVLTSNLGKAEVSGIDVFANYRQSLGNGRLDIALNGTLMNQFDQTSPGGFLSHKVGTIVEEDGTPVLGADRGGVILKWKHTLSATWTQGQFAGTLTQNYSDKYRAGNDLNDQPVYVNAQSIYDLNLAYKVSQESTVMLGLKNIFDTQPGVFVPASNQFQQGYDVSQYDPRGRFFYVSAKFKF